MTDRTYRAGDNLAVVHVGQDRQPTLWRLGVAQFAQLRGRRMVSRFSMAVDAIVGDQRMIYGLDGQPRGGEMAGFAGRPIGRVAGGFAARRDAVVAIGTDDIADELCMIHPHHRLPNRRAMTVLAQICGRDVGDRLAPGA